MGDDPDDGEMSDDIFEEYEIDVDGWEDLPDDVEEASKLLLTLQGFVPDVVKRALTASVDGLSEGEDRLREAVGERQLPREAVAYLLEHADSFKDDLVRRLAREVREVLEEADLGGELARLLTRVSLEATIQIRFRENRDADSEESVEPSASGQIRVREDDDGE